MYYIILFFEDDIKYDDINFFLNKKNKNIIAEQRTLKFVELVVANLYTTIF